MASYADGVQTGILMIVFGALWDVAERDGAIPRAWNGMYGVFLDSCSFVFWFAAGMDWAQPEGLASWLALEGSN